MKNSKASKLRNGWKQDPITKKLYITINNETIWEDGSSGASGVSKTNNMKQIPLKYNNEIIGHIDNINDNNIEATGTLHINTDKADMINELLNQSYPIYVSSRSNNEASIKTTSGKAEEIRNLTFDFKDISCKYNMNDCLYRSTPKCKSCNNKSEYDWDYNDKY